MHDRLGNAPEQESYPVPPNSIANQGKADIRVVHNLYQDGRSYSAQPNQIQRRQKRNQCHIPPAQQTIDGRRNVSERIRKLRLPDQRASEGQTNGANAE